ncbi:MAG: HNH endonuclease, partial [Pirellulales bacterium]
RDSLAIFAEHWTDRGLRLTPRTLNSIGQLIAEELGRPEDAFDADDIDASSNAAEGAILLAAAPRRGGAQGKQKTTTEKSTGHRAEGKPSKAMPFGKRLPAGEWIQGTEGNGVFKLDNPIELSTGDIVKEIEYKKGLPIFDKWAVEGEDIVIAITGKQSFDRSEALNAWKEHTGKATPEANFVFHHDGLTTEIGKHKGQTIFTGRMQLVPRELNELPHIGAASVARQYTLDPKVAREVNALAMKGKGPLGTIRKRIASRLASQAKNFGKAIPIIGGAITLVFFAEDVEAHGVGGAIVRATPLLGDIVGAYDLGKELAANIREQARENLRAAYADANDPIRLAHTAARRQTAAAFNELAKNIRVTKYVQPDEMIDAIKEPLRDFYGEVHWIYVQMHRGMKITHPPGAAPANPSEEGAIELRLQRAKEKLDRELRNKLQKPPVSGSQSVT